MPTPDGNHHHNIANASFLRHDRHSFDVECVSQISPASPPLHHRFTTASPPLHRRFTAASPPQHPDRATTASSRRLVRVVTF